MRRGERRNVESEESSGELSDVTDELKEVKVVLGACLLNRVTFEVKSPKNDPQV